jgi:hypothetical protein
MPNMHAADQPPDAEHEGEFGRRLQGMFDGPGWFEALDRRAEFPIARRDDWDPGPERARAILEGHSARFIPANERIGERPVTSVENPDPNASFGFVGACVRIDGEQGPPKGLLVMRVSDDSLGTVAPDTLRLFHWEDERREFEPVRLSGMNTQGNYVWGRIHREGTYGLIGINTDPRVLQTILVFKENEALLETLTEPQRRGFIDKVCGLILCAPGMLSAGGWDVAAQRLARWHQAMGLDSHLPSARPLPATGNLCERCLGLSFPAGRLPESTLFPRPWSDGGVVVLPGCAPSKPQWESLGPTNMAGCMMDVCVDPNNSRTVFAAARHGGIWRLRWNQNFTSYTWDPLTDDHDTLAMHAVAIAPSRSQTIYAANESGRILQSRDGGANWTIVHAGGARVNRLLVHPHNDLRVFAATSGGLLDIDTMARTATIFQPGDVTDVAIDPADPGIIFAAIRNVGVRRRDPATGTWTTVLSIALASTLSVGHYVGQLMRIAVGRRGTPATRRVAVKFGPRGIQANGTATADAVSEVFVSSTGGIGGWQRCTTPPALGNSVAGDWVNTIGVDPRDDDVLLVGGERLVRSVDGGRGWTYVMRYYYETGNDRNHEDHHGMSWDLNRPDVVYVANDGGIYISTDAGATWLGLNRDLVTTELFHFGVNRDPATGVKRAVANVDHWGELGTKDLERKQWEQIEGGSWEFVPARGDPKRADMWYFLRGGEIMRRQYPSTLANPRWSYAAFSHSWGLALDARPGTDLGLVSEFDGATGLSQIRRTIDAASNTPTWTVHALAPGVNLTSDQVMAIHFVPSSPNTAYAMTEQGRVLYCGDVASGAAWTLRGTWQGTLRWLAVDYFDPNLLIAITPSAIGRSRDGGATWQNVLLPNATLPPGELLRIIASPAYSGDFFLCTMVGVFYTPDEAEHWRGMHEGLPNAAAWEFAWLDGLLYIATYGRGLWRYDPYR